MISTVTTSTVAILAAASMAGSVALVVIVVLFALLLQKELSISSSDTFMQRLGRALNVAIFPLLIAFLLLVIIRVAEVLSY